MSRSTFFYTLWCLFVIAMFIVATLTGYSPFADGGRPVFVHASTGPMHK